MISYGIMVWPAPDPGIPWVSGCHGWCQGRQKYTGITRNTQESQGNEQNAPQCVQGVSYFMYSASQARPGLPAEAARPAPGRQTHTHTHTLPPHGKDRMHRLQRMQRTHRTGRNGQNHMNHQVSLSIQSCQSDPPGRKGLIVPNIQFSGHFRLPGKHFGYTSPVPPAPLWALGNEADG